MAETVRPGSDEGRPDPANASTPAEFVDAMLRLKQWTGWGFRQLEKRATAAGHQLPRSTLTAALARDTLPREDLIAAFTLACGCAEAETALWIASRRRIAGAPIAPVAPGTAPTSARAPRRGWRTRPVGRRAFVTLAAAVTLVLATGIGGYLLLRPDEPSTPVRDPGQAAPAATRPDPSRPHFTPESSTPTTEPTTATPPVAGTPAVEVVVPQPAPAQPPAPSAPSSTPATVVTPPPAPEESGRDVIWPPGEPTIYCPRPYLSTRYAALAQCTQVSGDQARPGYYSPYNHQFNATTGWMTVDDQKWYEAEVLATDGVRAPARGYTIVKTVYGGAVYATQYRDGEARWGIINVIDGQFRPGSQGWQPIGP